MNNEDKDRVDVTIQWYKANVVRIVFDGRMLWETKEIALDDVIDPDTAFSETTVRLNLLEATSYTQILYRGLQVGRLEQVNLLVQLRIEQWQLKIILFEKQLKQRVVDLGLAQLLKAIDPDEPGCGDDDGDTLDDDEPHHTGRVCDCEGCIDQLSDVLDKHDECLGDCDDCNGAYCDSLGIDDIPEDDDTLRLCKGCDVTRNSCAGCPDADPDDRFMNYGDVDMQKNNERARSNGKRVGGAGGVGLASDDEIYTR